MYDIFRENEHQILSKTIEAGADYADIRFESVTGTGLEMKERELRKAIPGESSGVLLRALVNGSWGILSFNDERSIDTAHDLVVKFARSSGPGDIVLADPAELKKTINWKPKIPYREISIEEKHSLLTEINTSVIGIDGIQGITTGYRDSTLLKRFLSSQGSEMEYTMSIGHVQSQIIAKRDNRILGYRTRVGAAGGYEIFSNEDPREKAIEGAKIALDILAARSAPSGRLTVIADNELTGVFAHEAIGHATEGDLIMANESILKGKIGQQVADEQITLTDDATIPGGFGSYPIDDEGIISKRKVLIENGILRGYILDRETAHALSMEPNGGSRAQSYSSSPLVRMSNTMIEAGTMSFEELIEDIDHGVYALGTRGGQVDTVRGSFQFSAQQAFLIEKGEITIPLRDVSLSGMTLEIMKNIDGIGKDAKLGDPGFCGKGQMVPVGDGGPHIRIRNAVVGGGA
jgi:TldD protein